MHIKNDKIFSYSIFLFWYKPKLNFGRPGVAESSCRTKVQRFCEARYKLE